MERRDGYGIFNEGNIYRFGFEEKEAWPALVRFKPDLIYCQQEMASYAASQASGWAAGLRCKFVLFCWENLEDRVPKAGRVRPLQVEPDMVISGNEESAKLHRADRVMPQVGFSPDIFSAGPELRPTDVAFASGKHTYEKGYALFAKLPFSKTESPGGIPYERMPDELYWRAKAVATPSRDTQVWKEQFAPAVNVEALMSGCYVVASDSAAMAEWLDKAPGVRFFPQGDYGQFELKVRAAIGEYGNSGPNEQGSSWATREFGFQAVGDKLLKAFSEI